MTIPELQGYLQRLRWIGGKSGWKAEFRRIAKYCQEFTVAQFRNHVSPEGSPWEPLRKKTSKTRTPALYRPSGSKPATKFFRVLKSAQAIRVRPEIMEFGFLSPGQERSAAKQQYGGFVRGHAIPPREMVGWTSLRIQFAMQVIEQGLEKRLEDPVKYGVY